MSYARDSRFQHIREGPACHQIKSGFAVRKKDCLSGSFLYTDCAGSTTNVVLENGGAEIKIDL
jgi:hypothetical protein